MSREENINLQASHVEPKGAQSQKLADQKKLSITQRKFKIIRDGANRDHAKEDFLQTPTIIKRSQIDVGQGIIPNAALKDDIVNRNSEQIPLTPSLNKETISAGGQQIITDHNHPMFLDHQNRD